MRAKKGRLQPVIEIAETRQEEAARQLAHMMQYQAKLEQQIVQLKTYREDYNRNQLLGQSLDTTTFHDRQLFLSRLNQNIEEIERQLQNVEKNLATRMDYWKQTRARTQALDKVMQRFRAQERRQLDHRLQKEHDEMAAQKTTRDKS